MKEPHSQQFNIAPLEEFYGHFSNLQAWAENNYNTEILHRNIAFPLLRKLTDIGDLLARKVFKEELIYRFTFGHLNVMGCLIKNDYLKHFTKDELDVLVNTTNLEFLRGLVTELIELLESEHTDIHSICKVYKKLINCSYFPENEVLYFKLINQIPSHDLKELITIFVEADRLLMLEENVVKFQVKYILELIEKRNFIFESAKFWRK